MFFLQVSSSGDTGAAIASSLFFLAIRVVAIIVCVKKAKQLNRNTTSWGILALLFPIIMMIAVQFKKPKVVWDKNTDNK